MLKLYKEYTEILTKAKRDAVSAYAGQSTLFILIALFPFVMFLMTLLHYFPVGSILLSDIAREIFPKKVLEFVMGIIDEINGISQTTALVSLTSLTALWSTSSGVLAIIRALDAINGEKVGRSYFTGRLLASVYAVVFAVIIFLVLLLLNFGNNISVYLARYISISQKVSFLAVVLRVAFVFSILTLFFVLIFSRLPKNKLKMRTQLPGAVLCSFLWIVFSFLYSMYISQMGAYSRTYGSLTAAVLLMLWLYFCIYVMLMCAELNSFYLQRTKK